MIFGKSVEEWNSLKGCDTAREINQQPETWKKTYALVEQQKDAIEKFIHEYKEDGYIVFSGAGTSAFIGNALIHLLKPIYGHRVMSIPTTDVVATPELSIPRDKKVLLFSFGRSGNSPESVATVDLFNQLNDNVKHMIVTCNHEGSLAQREGEEYYALKLPKETNDQSFAMTSSYTNMLLAAYLILTLEQLEENRNYLKEVIEQAIQFKEQDFKLVENVINEYKFERIVYLGDAEFYGLAEESSLKMLELTAGDTIVSFNTPLGFRHGPKSIINNETLIVMYLNSNEYIRRYQVDLLNEISIQRKDNKVLVLDCMKDDKVRSLSDYYHVLEFQNQDNPLKVLSFALIPQAMSLFKALEQEKTPDNPWPSGEVNRVVKGVVIYPYK